MGTSGNTKNDAIGKFPTDAFEEANNQAEENRFAMVRELKSDCFRISSSPGNKADMVTVSNCKTAMSGHTKKTKLAGVTNVGKELANTEFVVGPTVFISTLDKVA